MTLREWVEMARAMKSSAEPNRMSDAEIDAMFDDLRAMNLPGMRLPN